MSPEDDTAVELSIVIPAFNERERLPQAIAGLRAFLDAEDCLAEVLVVENGSTDGTGTLADELARQDERIRVLRLDQRGKGLAVRTGALASRGQIVVMCDVDFSMPVGEITHLVAAVEAGADVVIASREAPGARRIGEPWRRHFTGRIFNGIIQRLAGLRFDDTQCGFKAFRRSVADDLFRHQRIGGWAFDVELLFIAQMRGYHIAEVPITWRYDASSRIRIMRDTIAMLRELVMIRMNAMRGLYG